MFSCPTPYHDLEKEPQHDVIWLYHYFTLTDCKKKFDIQPLEKEIHDHFQSRLYALPNQQKRSTLVRKEIITPFLTTGGMNPPNLAFQNNL
jgi:hypothetical protein